MKQLELGIERLVREHLAACERSAGQAVARAFGSKGGAGRGRGGRRAGGSRAVSRRRRSAAELAALGERLYSVICDRPGETMQLLAAEVGVQVGQLHLPMTQLKQAGRLRSVGQRQFTRYFPMATPAAKTA